MVIDSHQHFWKYNPSRDKWIDENMEVIKRDFSPSDLFPILQSHGIGGCVAVQADQSEAETEYLLTEAVAHDFIKGVVGWIDLRSPNCEDRLNYFCNHPYFKGVRHILQAETPEFMLSESFKRGIKSISAFQIPYDLLVYPHHLEATITLVNTFPEQQFILDHLAKPDIKNGKVKEWAPKIKELAKAPNVACKVSGMVTEADWNSWNKETLTPYMDVVFDAFGAHRILYGSDWPVCLLAGQYKQVYDAVTHYCSKLSKREQDLVFGENAINWYNLSV